MSAPWPNCHVDVMTRNYYDRMTTEAAMDYAREMIEEWSYTQDPHGYCHVRPMLARLVWEIKRGGLPAKEQP